MSTLRYLNPDEPNYHFETVPHPIIFGSYSYIVIELNPELDSKLDRLAENPGDKHSLSEETKSDVYYCSSVYGEYYDIRAILLQFELNSVGSVNGGNWIILHKDSAFYLDQSDGGSYRLLVETNVLAVTKD